MMSPMRARLVTLALFGLALSVASVPGCGNDADAEPDTAATGDTPPIDLEGEPASPPFRVSGELEGLMLVWFDEDGPHTATRRSDVPEAHRERVRVDSLRLGPDERLDPDRVWVADLREEHHGRYDVRTLPRASFDALVDRVAHTEPPPPAVDTGDDDRGEAVADATDADVIIYGADWCGACRSTASFLRQRHVAFVEKNVERDPSALAEMQAKARRAGINPTGIPVIDFRGTMLTGFDPARLDALIRGT